MEETVGEYHPIEQTEQIRILVKQTLTLRLRIRWEGRSGLMLGGVRHDT